MIDLNKYLPIVWYDIKLVNLNIQCPYLYKAMYVAY